MKWILFIKKNIKNVKYVGKHFNPQKQYYSFCYNCRSTIKRLIEEFIQALEEEINSPKTKLKILIIDGKLIHKRETLYTYSFHSANEDKIYTGLDDAHMEIRINGLQYSGGVVGVKNSEIIICINSDLGESIPKAELIIDRTFLYRNLKEKLEAILESNDISKEYLWLSNLIFIEKARFFQAKSGLHSLLFDFPIGFKFNQSQIRAIQISQQSPLTLIWGPPGTGKTKTLAGVVAEFLEYGKKVLVTAHSNIAVDEATVKIAELLKKTNYYQNGEILRIGNYQKLQLKTDYPLILPEEVLKNKVGSLWEKKEILLQKHKRLTEYENFILEKRKIIEKSETKITIQKELKEKKKFLKELESKHKKEKLLQELTKTLGNEEKSSRRINLRESEIPKEIEQLEKELKELELFESSFQKKFNGIKLSCEEILEWKRKIESELERIEKKIRSIEEEILTNSKVICTTLTKTFSDKQVSEKFFDVLIIDEASMAPIPYLYWALRQCKDNVIIVGDFLQLQPICNSENEKGMAKKWLCRSIYNHLELDTVLKAVDEKKVCLLETQYRMNPKISKISNEIFYHNFLKNGEGTEAFNLDFGEFKGSLILVDTSFLPLSRCESVLGSSRVNRFHIEVVVRIIKKILSFQESRNRKIGVITPYRPQAKLIRKKIKEEKIKFTNISVATVHRFQGGEADIIIFDTVDAPGLKTSYSMLDNEHKELLNVALTRAKCKIFLVVNLNFIEKHFFKNSFIIKVIDIFKQNGLYIRLS